MQEYLNNPALWGKRALVTGSTRGIGRAIASGLLEAGCAVALNCIHYPEQGLACREELSILGLTTLVIADAGTGEGIATLLRTIMLEETPLDYLVHTVGLIQHKPWDRTSEEEWDQSMAVNLKSAWLIARQSAPWMADGGAILFLASTSAERVETDALPYSVAKAGLLALTRGLAAILAPRLRVNALSPGYINTGFDPQDQDMAGQIAPRLPLRRYGSPKEVAQAALTLLANPFITGQILRVDGGESLL
ncbi:MAG: SDR family oxidoreductase [Coprothermobacterota bacterium]|nr:SDR family oxidoreductase [Coprothermobacterota bacterium]